MTAAVIGVVIKASGLALNISDLILFSPISMNVLIIDPKTICVEATEEKMIKQMESFGLDVIPVPFRDVYAFGGSLHCATTDVHREGECEDYFPNQ